MGGLKKLVILMHLIYCNKQEILIGSLNNNCTKIVCFSHSGIHISTFQLIHEGTVLDLDHQWMTLFLSHKTGFQIKDLEASTLLEPGWYCMVYCFELWLLTGRLCVLNDKRGNLQKPASDIPDTFILPQCWLLFFLTAYHSSYFTRSWATIEDPF